MLEHYRVLTTFALFAGMKEHEAMPWRSLCENAAAHLLHRLRNDVTPAQHMERLCTAAAGIAYADYLAVSRVGAGADEMRVGDVTLRGTGDVNAQIQEIRTYFLGQVADLTRPESFAFVHTGEGEA